ncbi:MAG: hypothetical protein OD811_06440 [Alphaproteobacteria bacterium]
MRFGLGLLAMIFLRLAFLLGLWFTFTEGFFVFGEVRGQQQVPVVWDVFLWGESRYDTTIIEALAGEVEDRSGGSFVFNLLMGTPEIPRGRNLQMVSLRVAEAAMICLVDNPHLHPKAMVLHLPFLPVADRSERIALARSVYGHPEVREEFGVHGARVLVTSIRPSLSLLGRGEFPAVAESFAGYPMLVPGHLADSLVEYLEIERVRLPALEGAGAALLADELRAVALMPVAHQVYESYVGGEWWAENFGVGNLDCPVVVGEGAYSDLSPEHLAILEESIEVAYVRGAERDAEILAEWDTQLLEHGIEKVSYLPSVVADFRRIVGEAAALAWIEEMASVDEVVDEVVDVVEGEEVVEDEGGVDVGTIYEFVRGSEWRGGVSP